MPHRDDAKKSVTPRLRFPEFRNTGPWVTKRLEDVAPFQRGFDLPSTELQPGPVPVVYSNGVQNFHSNGMAQGPGLVTGRSGTIGKLHYIASGDYWPHNTSLWVTSFKDHLPKFVYFLYDTIGMTRFASGSGVPTLNRNDVHAFEAAIPTTPAEQQKIADCLTSLDDLVAAQGRKVEALAAHKKGLMQQLFPRQGESLPRLRFPEFRNAGEWRSVPLGEVIEVASGQVDPTEPPYSDYPQIGSENIESDTGKLVNVKSASEKGVISGNYAFDENDLLYSKIRPALSKVAAPEFSGICSADIYPLRPSTAELRRSYLLYLLLSQSFLDYAIRNSARGKIPKINRDALLTYVALIPSPAEQQRIADCLGVLDAAIAAETDRLAALRTHKKGLMQQLFPVPES